MRVWHLQLGPWFNMPQPWRFTSRVWLPLQSDLKPTNVATADMPHENRIFMTSNVHLFRAVEVSRAYG